MSKKDILRPHRLLVNRSLRREAEKLRKHIDEYKERYELQYQKNIEELETARSQLDSQYESAQSVVLDKLSAYADAMKMISEAIATHVEKYFCRQVEYKRRDINAIQIRSVDEYISFLVRQMREIGVEIDALSSRRDLLTSEAEVEDILTLLELSGCAIPAENVHDAKELLNIVNARIDIAFEEDRVAWYALMNVKRLLEERVSFLSEVQYITWVIEQKRQLSKELKITREEQQILKEKLSEEAEDIRNKIEEYTSFLRTQAQEIRFYWAKEIIYSNAELSNCYEEIENVKYEQRRLKDDWDDYKNESLSNEYLELSENIPLLKSKISMLKSERKEILACTFQLNAPIMRIGEKDQNDEDVFAETRMKELALIEEEGRNAAELVYKSELKELEEERDKIIASKQTYINDSDKRLLDANKALSDAKEQVDCAKKSALNECKGKISRLEHKYAEQKQVLLRAEKTLANAISADKRLIIVRWFSDTQEEINAKKAVAEAKANLKRIDGEINSEKKAITSGTYANVAEVQEKQLISLNAQERINKIISERDSVIADFERSLKKSEKKIRLLRPVPERPTSEEKTEISNIKMWQEKRSRRKENE